MIEFLKNIIKKVNFKSDNEELNKFNKIIYSVIILCALCFIGLIIYFVVKQLPSFIDSVQTNWNDSKSILKQSNL
jgi:cell division protein FtsL